MRQTVFFRPDGRIEPKDQESWEEMLMAFRGQTREIEVLEPKRNLDQNAKVQVLARAISDHTGESMKHERDRAVLVALGLEEGLDDPIFILGQTIRPVKSTADLSKDQCSKVIDWLQQTCYDLNLNV